MAQSEVTIKFKGDKSEIARTIDEVKKETGGIGESMTRAGSTMTKGVTVPILAAGAALIGLGVSAGNTADELLDMRDQTGASLDTLQEMRYVASQAGVDQDFYARSIDEVIKAQDRLQKGTGPAAEALDALGVSVKNADGSMRSATEITDDAMQALAAIEDPTLRASLAQDIFKRAHLDLLPVLGQGTEAIEDQRRAAHELGAVQSEESLQSANKFRQGMERLKTGIGGVVGSLGGALAPILTDTIIPMIEENVVPLVETFAGWIETLSKKFQDLPGPVQKAIMIFGGLAAAAGPVLSVGGKLVSNFGAVAKGFKALSTVLAANPYIAIIAATVAIVTLIITNWDTIKEFLIKVWDTIKEIAGKVWGAVKDAFKAILDTIKGIFETIWNGIRDTLRTLWNGIKSIAETIWNGIKGFFDSTLGAIKAVFETIWNGIRDTLSTIWGGISSVASTVWNGIKDVIAGVLGTIKDLFLNWTAPGLIITHWDSIKEAATAVWEWVRDRFNDLVGFFKELPGKIASALGRVAEIIAAPFRAAWEGLVDLYNDTVARIPGVDPIGGGGGKQAPGGGGLPGLPKTGGGGVPMLHRGGVFRTATPGGSGLAILQDEERVIPADAQPMGRMGGGGKQVIQLVVDGRVLAEVLNNYERGLA